MKRMKGRSKDEEDDSEEENSEEGVEEDTVDLADAVGESGFDTSCNSIIFASSLDCGEVLRDRERT